jgi:hypothetical protein
MANKGEIKDLPTSMRQLHDYYVFDTIKVGINGFEVIILPGLLFHKRRNEALCRI